MMDSLRVSFVTAILAGFLAQGQAASAERFPSGLPRGMRDLFVDARVRTPGSPGNQVLENRVDAVFQASGLKSGSMAFRVPSFVPGAATLQLGSAAPLPIWAMHAGVMRPGNFEQRDLPCRLVYLGQGESEDLAALDGVDLKGSVAVLEMSCRASWPDLMRFGIRGVLFLASDDIWPEDCFNKVTTSEARVPRYYVDEIQAPAIRDTFKVNRVIDNARIQSEPSRWENRIVRNLWVFIPGHDPLLNNDVMVVTAPLDADGLVPGLAEGAQSGANLHLLLQMLESFRSKQPARSVLLVAVNAHTLNYTGERMLAWHLLAPMEEVEIARNTMAKDLERQELFTRYYEPLKLIPETRIADHQFLLKLRNHADKSTGRFVTIKDPLVALARRDVNMLRGRQLDLSREGLTPDELETKRLVLEAERQKYVHVLTLFNRFGIQTTLDDLYERSPESLEILRGYRDEILNQNRLWAGLNRADLAMDIANSEIRTTMEGRRVALAVNLDFDWTSSQIGFSSAEPLSDATRWQARFGRNMVGVSERMPGVPENPERNLLVDTLTRVGGLKEDYFFPVKGAGLGVFHAADATPAFSFRNVYTAYGQIFSPHDTFDRLNPAHIQSVTTFVPDLIRAFLDEPGVTGPEELPPFQRKRTRRNVMWSIQMKTFKFDEFGASVLPSLPVPGCLLLLAPGSSGINPDGVVRGYTALTDDRADTMVYGVTEEGGLLSTAYHFDPDFIQVDYTIDAGDVHQRVPSTINKTTARVLALFACKEVLVPSCDDSSLVSASGINVRQFQVLNAMRHAAPRRYGFWGANSVISDRVAPAATGPACLYFDGEEPVKLLTAQKRTALNASEEDPLGVGYTPEIGFGDDFFRTVVNDMSVLNRYRVATLRGVSDELTKDFLERGDAALKVMESDRVASRHLDYLRNLYAALGSHVKAYTQTAAITNDMLKAVVFYMAVMLPFCFFVQKLLFKFVRIEAQMGMFVLIFVLTFLVFRMIHPAFRIAQAPEAMFVAFIMGGLGFFVINVLHARFEGEMQVLFQTYTGMDTTEVGYSTVTQQAMLIGVNNMKRRRIRTTLTTATIVLVTFTMLAFSSISKKMSPTVVPKSKKAPYTGIMYHWPGQPMDVATAQVMERIFHGRADVNIRYWLMSPRALGAWQPEIIPMHLGVQPGKRMAQIYAVLGLQTIEDGFIESVPMVQGSRFFTANDADEVIIPAAIADVLGVTPENMADGKVIFRNREYRIVGILDDDRFRSIRDLDERPLTPIQVKKQTVQSGDEEAGVVEEDGGTGVEYVDTGSMILMPATTLARLGGQPYSVSIRFKDDEPIWSHVEELLTATQAKFYVSSRLPFQAGSEGKRQIAEGIYYMGSGYRTSIGGLSKLIIPLLIASTIILNTMLGAVYERKSEIAVYNAVGLNPTHIGTFFLAEAFVYSIIGSVGGYLIGQVLSISLNRLGLVDDINLNFSSLSVVYVILFTITVVMLSTLYPAHMATKSAVPSGKRKWSLPPHDGKRMEVPFPFIYQEALAPGIMAYLDEYFSRFTEASLGDLIAHPQGHRLGQDAKGRPVYQSTYHLALAPFDLGVTQDVLFTAQFDERVQSYRVTMVIERSSGQDSNWVATNKPYLEHLRQYLLHWRNLTPAQHGVCSQQGSKWFESATRT
ncbi:MAG: hypothetical protein A2340_12105 [Lentisphaerae bacterium RIFOXYB12_FULL_60_10]|nr:MAG: hypothetical protein A2340_12105 [Lentisphaerae bacterium RIFOXYB12_FULL_60_10]